MQRIAHGVGADVRDIDEHADAVQLLHHSLAEFGEAEVQRTVGSGVGPIHVVPMRERQITAAQFIKHTQGRRRILDHVAALYTHQAGDAARSMDAIDVGGGTGLFEFRPAADEPQSHVKFAHGFMQRGVADLRGRLHKDRPILDAETALAHAGDVGAQGGLRLAKVDGTEIAGLEFQQHRWQVVMRVDERSFFEECLGASEQRRGVAVLRGCGCEEGGTSQQTALFKKVAA